VEEDGTRSGEDGAMSTSSGEKHPARPCSPTPRVGIVAARLMEVEREKDGWRRIARDDIVSSLLPWYLLRTMVRLR
jgi:hypothetical protein